MHKVAIFLATYNGASYLLEQLRSLYSQAHVDISIFLSDDHSSDHSIDVVRSFCSYHSVPLHEIHSEQRLGSAAMNFLSMVASLKCNGYDYIAFSDQDDVWLPNKLSNQINSLKSSQASCCSCSLLPFKKVEDNYIFSSVIDKYLPEFGFLFQSASAGCSYLFKYDAYYELHLFCNSLLKAGFLSCIYSHDVFFHCFFRLLSFKWIHLPNQLVLYRQHSRNAWGSSRYSFRAIFSRLTLAFQLKPFLLLKVVFLFNRLRANSQYKISFSSEAVRAIYCFLFDPTFMSLVAVNRFGGAIFTGIDRQFTFAAATFVYLLKFGKSKLLSFSFWH